MGKFYGEKSFENRCEAVGGWDIFGAIALTADGGFAVEYGKVTIGPETTVALVLATLPWMGQHFFFDAHRLKEVAF